jgi:hypothetical protein
MTHAPTPSQGATSTDVHTGRAGTELGATLACCNQPQHSTQPWHGQRRTSSSSAQRQQLSRPSKSCMKHYTGIGSVLSVRRGPAPLGSEDSVALALGEDNRHGDGAAALLAAARMYLWLCDSSRCLPAGHNPKQQEQAAQATDRAQVQACHAASLVCGSQTV